jgi:hypothetical protein
MIISSSLKMSTRASLPGYGRARFRKERRGRSFSENTPDRLLYRHFRRKTLAFFWLIFGVGPVRPPGLSYISCFGKLIRGFLGPEEPEGIMALGLPVLPAVFFAAALVPAPSAFVTGAVFSALGVFVEGPAGIFAAGPAAAVFPLFSGFAAGAEDFFSTGCTGFPAAGLADLPVVAVFMAMEYLFF